MFMAVMCVAVLSILWAVIEALGYSITHHYPLVQIVGMRYAVHLLVLAALCVPRSGWRRLVVTRRPFLQLGRGFCMFVMPASFIAGGAGLSANDIWSMFWLSPIMIVALAWWWLGERFPSMVWGFVLVACAGAFAIYGQPPRFAISTALPVLGALSFAIYVVLSRHLRDEPIETNLFYTGLGAFVCMLPFAIMEWQPIQVEDVWRIVAIGVIGLVLLMLLDLSLDYMPASFVAPFLYGAVVCEAGLRVLLSGHLPSPIVIAGSTLVLLAMLNVMIFGVNRERY